MCMKTSPTDRTPSAGRHEYLCAGMVDAVAPNATSVAAMNKPDFPIRMECSLWPRKSDGRRVALLLYLLRWCALFLAALPAIGQAQSPDVAGVWVGVARN